MKQSNRIKKVHSFGLLKKTTLFVLVAVLGFFVVAANQVFASDFDENDGLYYSDFTSFEETEEHALVVNEKIGEEGFILLKNDGVLPTVNIENVTVFGKNSVNMALGGGGSGAGNTSGAKDIFDSLDAAGFNVNPVLKTFYENDDTPARSAGGMGGGAINIGETDIDNYGRQQTDSFALFNDAAIVVITRSGSEGGDLPRLSSDPDSAFYEKHYLELSQNELDMLALVKANFENIIVIINNSSPLELGSLEDDAAINAIVWVGHPGTNAIMALGGILNGTVNPSGRTVDIYPADFTTDPTYQNFGDNSQSTDSSINIFETEDVEGVPTAVASGSRALMYEEGIYVGYRYYETRGEVEGGTWYEDNVVYPFGYGLSYTSFNWAIVPAETTAAGPLASADMITVTVNVTNTGVVAGKDVVELYYSAPYTVGGIEKASVVLGGFAKTDLLQPGESQEVVIELYVQDMASYDYDDANANSHKGYELDAGTYEVKLMKNSHDEVASISYTVAATINYDTDRITGNAVENRFTDDPYFNSLPDADDVTMTHMSRADFAGTFPVAPSVADLTIGATSDLVSGIEHVFVLDDLEDATAPWYKTAADMESIDGTVQYTQASAAEVAARVDGLVTTQLTDMIGVAKDDAAWDAFLNQLSFEELNLFVSNGGYRTAALPAVGKEQGTDADGPAGFGSGFYWASEVTIASTWNVKLAEQMGRMVGNEALWLGISGWYGPAMNFHRNQFAGRNFEYYSEDGLLGGKIAAATVYGAQTKGLFAYIKHFAVNDQETNRQGISTFLDEQSLRELYLKPFQIAVEEGGAMGVMSAFNRIGAVDASANYALLTEILRNEWGFEGHVVTDYYSGKWNSSYMNLNELWPMGNDIPLNGRGTLSSGYYATWDETEAAPVYTNESDAVVVSYSQWWAVRNSAKNILYTTVNSSLMHNFVDLGEIETTLTAGTQAASYNVNVIPEGLSNVQVALASNSSLPEGLSLSADGTISGISEVSGTFTFSIDYIANYWAEVDTVEYTLVLAPAFSVNNLDDLEENVAEVDGIVVSNAFVVDETQIMYLSYSSWSGTWSERYATLTEMTYAVADGSMLPDGLAIDAAGNITGTPTVSGTFDVVLQAHLIAGTRATQDVLIPVTLVIAAGTPLPTYDVTFAGNFTGASDEVISVVQDTVVAAPDAPNRVGAIFLGWFTDAEATTAVDFSANVAADVTYYAGWIDVVQLAADIASLDGDLAADISSVNAAITALQTALEADDTDLADDIASVNAAVTALQTALEAADDAIEADLADEIAALNTSISALNTSLSDDSERIDTIEATLAETGCGSSINVQSTIIFATALVLVLAVAFVMTRSKKQYNK